MSMAPLDQSRNRTDAEDSSISTSIADEVGRLDQALLDLHACDGTHVGLLRCPNERTATQLIRDLGQTAQRRGFVVCHMSLAEFNLDNIQTLVAFLIDALVSPNNPRSRGLLKLLDESFDRHGKGALGRFDAGCEEFEAAGHLTALCRAYLAAEDDARREVRAFELWAEGTEPSARYPVPGVRGALNEHNAQRTLNELTRLIRALGHQGLLMVFSHGDAITRRTPRQREKSYTLLREFVDNFDSSRGAISCKICLIGGDALFSGPRSLRSLAPLLARLELPSRAKPAPPHRSWTSVVGVGGPVGHRKAATSEKAKPAALRSLIRIAQGLPPSEAVVSMSVGHEKIDRAVDKLFAHARLAGSVFGVVSGDYGSGKTHLLLHLAERALAAGHPVFWLNLERMNLDLGSPQKHLRRILEQSVLPQRGRPNALARAQLWTRSAARMQKLRGALEEIAQSGAEEATAAKKALQIAATASDGAAALENFLAANDLAKRSSAPHTRLDAYRRLLLWAELLKRLDGMQGPVIIIDEAENLYTTGVTRSARRSALRALSFYCGGVLPEACVIMAITPPSLLDMKKESGELLGELEEVEATLDIEDVTLFKSRLRKLAPHDVPPLTRPMRMELAERVRATHKSVRGPVDVPHWEALVKESARLGGPPRVLVRRLVDELESAWWAGRS